MLHEYSSYSMIPFLNTKDGIRIPVKMIGVWSRATVELELNLSFRSIQVNVNVFMMLLDHVRPT